MKLFNQIESALGVLLSFTPILLVIYAAYFSFPQADDFGYAELVTHGDWQTEFIRLYTEWSGRYSAILTGFLSPLAFGKINAYGIVIIGAILGFVLSTLFFAFQIFKDRFAFWQIAIISFVFDSVYLNLMPSQGEGVFWYSGMITYFLPLVWLQLAAGSFVAYFRSKSLLPLISGVLWSLIGLGYNEILTTSLGLTAVIYAFVSQKNGLQLTYKIPVIISLVGMGLLLLAPGNGIRASMFSHNNSLFHHFLYTDLQSIRFSLSWLTNINWWMYFLFFMLVGNFLKLNNKSFEWINRWPVALFFLLPMIYLYVAIFPAYYYMGILGQHRTVNVAFYLILILWAIAGIRIGQTKMNLLPVFPFNYGAMSAIVIIWLSGLTITGNNGFIVEDIKNDRFITYAQIQKNRIQQLEEGKNIVFEPLSDSPCSFHILDLTNDPNHWINQNWKRYFNLNSIRTYEKQ